MSLLAILFVLFGFLFLGVGSGSNTTSSLPQGSTSSSSPTNCVVVTWRKGQPAHKRPCRSAASRSGSVHRRPVMKCSPRMTANSQTRKRCWPLPAKP